MRNYKKDRTMVQVRVQADTPYQVKRVMEAVGKEKGMVLMSSSGIKKNSGDGPRLREFASFRDLKEEKKIRKENQRKNKK